MFSVESYRNRALVFGLVLLLLLTAFPAANWRPMLFFAHIGAVLLWQPIVSHRKSLNMWQVAMIAGPGALVAVYLSAWPLLAWATLLTGLVAGRITLLAPRVERALYLAALAFMIIVLFLLVVPGLLPEHLRAGLPSENASRWLLRVLGIALLPIAALAWKADQLEVPRVGQRRGMGAAYDLVYTAWVVVLLLLLVFFGIALMAVSRNGYLESMALTLIGVSGTLLAFSWLWSRFQGGEGERSGGSALSILLSRYLLSFGLPYEVWLDSLTTLNRRESDPDKFLDGAMRGLGELAIVVGAQWRCDGFTGQFGSQEDGEEVHIEVQSGERHAEHPFEVVLRAREVLSPAFLWHFKLLIGLAAEFYWAKQREQKLVQDNYMRAVHETGARLTHDVKNLLQSIDGLVDAAKSGADDLKVRQLIGRHLPAISQRLAATLDRLRAPSTDSERLLRLSTWWTSVSRRHAHYDVVFHPPQIGTDLPIYETLFDSAADNLIQNALRKRATDPTVQVHATLVSTRAEVELAIEDTGAAVPEETASRLFKSPLSSQDGMGIGLYQLATKAQRYGYRLELARNQPGRVRILLTSKPESGDATGKSEHTAPA